MALRDIALTVLELESNEFHWVLMEAVQASSEESLEYRPIDSSTQGLPDYSEALIHGASALRVLQGLAPFGKPMAPLGFGESASGQLTAEEASEPAPEAAADGSLLAALAALAAQAAEGADPDPSAPAAGATRTAQSADPDSCMFTTGHSAL